MQSGSSSRSTRNRGAVEFGEEQPKTDASGEQQLKRTETGNSSHEADRCNRGAVTKRIDAIGEQQLKRAQSGSSSSAQRAVRRRITHVGEQRGSS